MNLTLKGFVSIIFLLALCNFYWALNQRPALFQDDDSNNTSDSGTFSRSVPTIHGGGGNRRGVGDAVKHNQRSQKIFELPDNNKYEDQLQETLKPLPHVNTTFHSKVFFAGLCNQYMRFMGLIFLASIEGYGQIIEESIRWKDTYGHNDLVPHYMLWDVVHWNTFYPSLPRLASFDPKIHTDLTLSSMITIDFGTGKNFTKKEVKYRPEVESHLWDTTSATITPPPLMRKPMEGKNKYKQLVRQIDMGQVGTTQPVQLAMYKTMLEGALRPHPFLQAIIDKMRMDLGGVGDKKGYMVLHARVEPDMARENERVCRQYRVMNMTDILEMIYRKFPEPPVQTVLIVFSRALMEDEAKRDNVKESDHVHVMNDHNLRTLADILQHGMWDGRVKVVEAGSQMVHEAGNDFYRYYSNIAGSIVNFFLAIQSAILVGTEISTFSTLAMNSRFYRGDRENYFYRPQGLHWMSPPNATKPHRFEC